MNNQTRGLVLGVKEHLMAGLPITQLESIAMFGVPSLTKVISDMRREGILIKTKRVPYVAAVARLNKHCTFNPPPNLPVREILLTEFRVST